MDYKDLIAKYFIDHLDLDAEYIKENLEVPPKEEMGEYALPCFRLAKVLKKSPQQIAQELVEKLEDASDTPDFIDRVEALGPYLNVYLARASYITNIVDELMEQGSEFASLTIGNDKTVCIDFSSPNIAKPFHVGHAFSTFLGDALARMYAHQGYEVERINHLGDYGTQFGKLIVAYEKWGEDKALEENAIQELLRIYAKFHQEAKTDPSLEEDARRRFKALEDKSPRELELWEKFRALSIEEFNRIYEQLDVKFDSYRGESFYSDYIPSLVQELEDKGLLVDSEGAKVVMLDEENLPPCLVLKSDGSSIYATRDLATAKFRYDTYAFDQNIYVVGLPQNLHFQQVFAVLKQAGYDWADDCVHVGFGLVKFPGSVLMSTRSGDVVYLEDLIQESVKKTREIILENNVTREEKMDEAEVSETATAIGLGAIRYTFLRSSREKDIIFRWEDILDFDGDSAPYMQYAYARARSILRKSGYSEEAITTFSTKSLGSESEFQLARLIEGLKDALVLATKNYEPSIFARQIMSMCRAFSRFYNQMPILQAPDEEKQARLKLCLAFQSALKTSLNLLGIQTVERM